MSLSKIIICSVAREAEPGETSTFKYKDGKEYKKLIDWDRFDVLLDLDRNTGFCLTTSLTNNKRHLILCYDFKAREQIESSEERGRISLLITSFFNRLPVANIEQRRLSIDDFYERLRQIHNNENFENIPTDVQHRNLRPILRPYQVKGIRWMLKREQETEYLPPHLIKMCSRINNNQILYFDIFTLRLELEPTALPKIKIPSGGLLTDEMGLGKTVEVLGLMLMNPRRVGTKRSADCLEELKVTRTEVPKSPIIKCVCRHEVKNEKKTDLVGCTLCETWQHIRCVFQQEVTDKDRSTHICPFCWKSTGNLLEASTTIIITPAPLKSQWRDEITRHVGYTNVRTLMYEGVSQRWIGPSELATYDVVITDFNTLVKELRFSEPSSESRSLRHEKMYKYPSSPLKSVKWWRVVLDEAQMVENIESRPSLMVAQLPAVHRWGTTGTPVEKDSLRSLYGLICFLKYEPFTNEAHFRSLIYHYHNGKPEGLIEVLSRIMWRTCKKNVEHEIQIPKQSEVMHEITMTDLHKVHYQQVHNEAKSQFLKKLQDFITHEVMFKREVDGKVVRVYEKVVNISEKESLLCNLYKATLSSFLEPLKKLRQDCTIASVSQSKNHKMIKQTLTPDQLHEHLVSKASLETKSALRAICSSTNAMAALRMATGKHEESKTLYKQVLKLAKDYKGTITVDSMLQIHALNTLMDLAVLTNDEEELKKKDEYLLQMENLEWKYISNFYEKVEQIKIDLKKVLPEVKNATSEASDMTGQWWRYIVVGPKSKEEENRLREMIEMDINSIFLGMEGSQLIQQLRSSNDILLKIAGWFDKIPTYHKEIQKQFNDFDFIINNLRPLREMSINDKKKLAELVNAALNCHLNLEENRDENGFVIAMPSRSKKLCDLCVLKSKLNDFECVLFNKNQKKEDDVVDGTWSPRLEEKMLKTVLTYAERAKYENGTLEMGNNFFRRLEHLKAQFKIQVKLWVEVNYTIGAFDEINMCKMRMQIVDSPDEITAENNRFKLKILRFQIDEQLEIFKSQKAEAEVNFVRFDGRLKYLGHLKGIDEPQVCPICTNLPNEKYYVTACGHLICHECFTSMVDFYRYRTSVMCPVCRTIHETGNIYAVTCATHSNEPIHGSFSPKIDEIVRSVLRLQQKEPDVKILIFSQWDQLLKAITIGLEANNIKFRSSFGSNFAKQIKEFKDFNSNVTCMMMNLKFGGKGLNIIEATHVFLVEPMINSAEELQAIGRVHRIGQTRETFVHRFITKNTIEETIYKKIICKKENENQGELTIRDLEELIDVGGDDIDEAKENDVEMEQ